jgi:hypothetical protein
MGNKYGGRHRTLMEDSKISDAEGVNEISEIFGNLSNRLIKIGVREISSSKESYARDLGIYFE